MSLTLGQRDRPWTFVHAAGASLAFLLGLGLALDPAATAIAVGAACFVLVVMVDVSLGFAVWIPAALVAPGIVTTLTGIVMATAWLGSIVVRRPPLRQVLPGQRFLVGAVGLLLGWLSLSLLWARDAHVAWVDLRGWLIAAAVLLVVATTVTSAARLRLVLAAFVVGALLSVAIGWVNGGSSSRFAGAEGNPNDLAAQLLPVIVLAVALIADRKRAVARVVLGTCVSILVIALVATQSRGGLVAAGLAILAASIVYNRHRRELLRVLALILAVAGAWLALNPGEFGRVTSFSDGGAGRTTLWQAAWRMSVDAAPVGAGLNNFRIVSEDYVREPGVLRYVGQIESPHVVHNTYLQLLAETGIPGLALFLVVVVASSASLRRAAQEFERAGRHDLFSLTQAILLAIGSVLAAQLFQSNGYDMGLWILLGLGPAMLAMSRAEGLGPRPLLGVLRPRPARA